MANFTPEFNREIRRVVKSFNQKIRRAEARGVKGLPEIRSVRELKAQFATENDLKREVASLKTLLNNKEALQRRTLKEGTVSNWQYEYLARNLQATKRFVDRELEKAEERLKEYPKYLYSIRADIETLEHKKDILNRDLSKLTADELRTGFYEVAKYCTSETLKLYADKHFSDDLEIQKHMKLSELKTLKEAKLSEFSYNDKIYQIDENSKVNLNGKVSAILLAQNTEAPITQVSWIAKDNSITQFTTLEFLAFSNAVAGYIEQILFLNDTIRTQINQAESIEALKAIELKLENEA
jgi:hypothetical protein